MRACGSTLNGVECGYNKIKKILWRLICFKWELFCDKKNTLKVMMMMAIVCKGYGYCY